MCIGILGQNLPDKDRNETEHGQIVISDSIL